MAQGHDSPIPDDDPSFDQWVINLGGPEVVVAIVETMQRQVADGSLVGFTDKDEFPAHLRRSDRRSARPGRSSSAPPLNQTSND